MSEFKMIQEMATRLGFKFILSSGSRHKLLMPNSGFGYQGTIDGCIAYLQGWEERGKHGAP